MTALIQAVAVRLRLARRRPFETCLAVVALTLGIGLSTAMFSILWGTVLRGLPFEGAERLVRIDLLAQGQELSPTDADFLAWRRSQKSFEGLAAWLG